MTIAMTSVSAISSTRVRVKFSSDVASGAYVTTLYAITSLDPTADSPWIKKVLAITGLPNTVELVLGGALASGGRYSVTAIGVPAVDTSVTPGGVFETLIYGTSVVPLTNNEPATADANLILYGRDIVWTGTDFAETADGNLATVEGLANAASAHARRMFGSPLFYAPLYSPNSREFVDAPDASALKNRLVQQSLRDPRVKSVTVQQTKDSDGNTVFIISPKFIGGESPDSVSLSVKT